MNWAQEKNEIGKKLINELYEQRLIKTWYKDKPSGWTLASGIWSPFYIQLRPISSVNDAKKLLKLIGHSISRIILNETKGVSRLLGIAYAGIPIAISTTMISGIPSCYTRKIDLKDADFAAKISSYGEHNFVEGFFDEQDSFCIVDDVVTLFDSKLEAIWQLKEEAKRRKVSDQIACNNIIVLVDREQGAKERAANLKINLHSVIPFKSKGIEWLKERISPLEYETIKKYLERPSGFQEESVKGELYREAIQNKERVGND